MTAFDDYLGEAVLVGGEVHQCRLQRPADDRASANAPSATKHRDAGEAQWLSDNVASKVFPELCDALSSYFLRRIRPVFPLLFPFCFIPFVPRRKAEIKLLRCIR